MMISQILKSRKFGRMRESYPTNAGAKEEPATATSWRACCVRSTAPQCALEYRIGRANLPERVVTRELSGAAADHQQARLDRCRGTCPRPPTCLHRQHRGRKNGLASAILLRALPARLRGIFIKDQDSSRMYKSLQDHCRARG